VDRAGPTGMNKHRGLIVAVLLFLGVRLLYPVLFVPAGNLADPEDLVRGTLAHDLIHGLKVPFWEYQADYYSGGSVVVGLLAVPFFLVFGPTLFALRLVAILFSLAVLLVWYVFVARNFESRAAFFTVLFFVAPPPVYLEGSSLAMGYHTESMLFSAVAFLLLFEMLRRDDGKIRWPAGLGLTLGFGSWFCYTTFVSVPIVLLWWFWHDHRFAARKSFGLFLAFFALGFAPWIPANLSHHFRGLEFLEEGLRYDYLRGMPETARRIAKTALWCLPTMFDPFQGTRSLAWPMVYAAPFGSSLLYLVVRNRGRASLVSPPGGWFFAAACVVYVVAVSATRYPLEPYGSLYLAPVLPLLFCAAGLSLSQVLGKGHWSRAAALTVLAVSMTGGALSLARSLDFRWPGASFAMPGYSYGRLAEAVDLRHPHDYGYYATLLPRVERTMTTGERSEFLRRLLWPNDYDVTRDGIAAEVKRFAAFPEPESSIGYFQLGIALEAHLSGADDSLAARLSQEYPLISAGARLGRVAWRFHVPGFPVVNRLPLMLDPDTRILFLDLGTHDTPGEFGWVRGREQATFLIESSRVMSSVDVRLTNGDRPNSATLASAQGVKSVGLAAGESVVETLDVGPGVLFDGKYYWKIAVRSRYGHFPILTRKELDTRYLGVHVMVRPQPDHHHGCCAPGSPSSR
jgi:4-amino-4-deoxy-L-arabinose transferase-like glycosyltransferase